MFSHYCAAYSQFLYSLLQSRRHVGHFTGSQAVSFKPPASWSDLVLEKNLVNMLFMVIGSFLILNLLLFYIRFIINSCKQGC